MAKKGAPAGVVPSDGAVGIFNSILRASYARIFATFEENSLATNGRRKEAMKQIEAIAEQTKVDLSAWVNVEVRAFYEKGMFETMKGIFDEGMPVRIDKAFAHFHEEAIKALAEVGISDIAKAMQGISASGQQIISNAARQAVLEQVATGQLLGETRRKIKDNVVSALKKNGVSALVDRGGKTWELSRYGSMLARTKMTQAHNSGAINRMAESGYDLVQVSDHFGECALCRPWEGQILSVTGQTKGYDSLGKAEAAGLFHPNCRHTITPAHAEYLQGSLVWDAEKGEYVPYGQQGKQDAASAPAMSVKPKDATDGIKRDVSAEIEKTGRALKIGISDFQAKFIKEKGVSITVDTKTPKQNRLGYYKNSDNSITVYKSAAKKDRNLDQTFYHELGHAIDYRILGEQLTKQPEWIRLSYEEKRAIAGHRVEVGMKKTLEKYNATPEEIEKVRNGMLVRRNITVTRNGKELSGYINLTPGKKYMDYARSNAEVFADGYGQYITDPTSFKKRAPGVYSYFKELETNYGKN